MWEVFGLFCAACEPSVFVSLLQVLFWRVVPHVALCVFTSLFFPALIWCLVEFIWSFSRLCNSSVSILSDFFMVLNRPPLLESSLYSFVCALLFGWFLFAFEYLLVYWIFLFLHTNKLKISCFSIQLSVPVISTFTNKTQGFKKNIHLHLLCTDYALNVLVFLWRKKSNSKWAVCSNFTFIVKSKW